MKNLFALILYLFAFQIFGNAQTNTEILPILRERVEVGRVNQSIVVSSIEEKGVRFTSLGKASRKPDAKNVDENTVFEIGSVTKVFTGTLLAEAVRRGEVKLDDPVSKYLPATVKTPTRNGIEITLLELATHTSGLPRLPANFAPKNNENPYADYSVEQMYDFLSKYELTRGGSEGKYDYSNFGMGLLGHILSLRAKMSYEDLVKSRILQPLKMNDTTITLATAQKMRMAQGFDINGEESSLWDLPTLAGAGGLRSTAKDMAKFVAANIGLEKSNLSDILSVAHKLQRDVSPQMKIGLAWHILQRPDAEIVWHNGGTGGFKSFIGFIKAQKRGVVVLSNSTESVDDIGMNILDSRLPLKKIKPFVAVSEKLLDEYAGEYELAPSVIFTIVPKGGKLFAQLTGQPNIRVFAESENKFYYKVVNARLTFNRGAGGKIESLTLDQNGEHIAKKIK